MFTSFDDSSFLKILSFLKTHESEFLSGQDMSDVLKISRVSVWKDIKKIRSLGYKIKSKQNIGYKLVGTSKLLLPWEVTQNLNTKFLGKRVYYFNSIDSTQNFALEIASKNNENGTVIISKRQTGGRGRMKRKWKSPIGGIWMSIIIQPKFDVSYATLVPVATSLALCIAIEKILKIKPELKWPNDITLKGKKVAGVLVDTSIISNEIENMVLGIGINFKIKPYKLTNTIKKTPNFYGITTLVKKNESALPLVQQFLHELETVFELINSRHRKKIKKEWTKRASTLGRNVSVITNDGKVNGKAVKIDDDGALIISKSKKTERILVGDVIQ
jgi:BirA family biotin operon repressor/biotin-[acetyl-CoA-carboxylase] ligase